MVGITPGATDRNVAEAWATWLLREDDSPVTFLDHMINGLGFGAVFGSAIDVLAFMLHRTTGYNASRGSYGWTRTGMKLGVCGGLTTYVIAFATASRSSQGHLKDSSSSTHQSAEQVRDLSDNQAAVELSQHSS